MIGDEFNYLKLAALILSYTLAVMPWYHAEAQPEKWLIVGGFFIFFGILITAKGQRLNLYQSSLAGGLTYPLYLVHAHIGYMLLNAYATDANKYWVYPMIFAFVSLVSYFIHYFVEKKMQPFWYTLFDSVVAGPISYIEQGILALKSRLAPASE
jgi:peptidoglycan/LPS O-acetylase OafA/YrhL